MTSEVDNILKGQVVAKTADLKQIAVSTSNLTPDELGVAPLEHQTAFTPVQENVNAPLEPIPVAPVIQQDNIQAEQPVLANPIDNNMNQNIVSPELQNMPTTNNEIIDSIDYNKPNTDGILTASPVDVVGPAGLDQMDLSSVENKLMEGINNLGQQAPVQEQTIQPMQMPTMTEEVNAQEPIAPDNRMFEGTSPVQTPVENTVQQDVPLGDTPFSIPAMDTNTQPIVNPVENAIESELPAIDAISNEITSNNEMDNINGNAPVLENIDEQPVETHSDNQEEKKDMIYSIPVSEYSAFDDHIKPPEELADELANSSASSMGMFPSYEGTIDNAHVQSNDDSLNIESFDEEKIPEVTPQDKSEILEALDRISEDIQSIRMDIEEIRMSLDNSKTAPALNNELNSGFENNVEVPSFGEIANPDPSIPVLDTINNVAPDTMNVDEQQLLGKF